MYCTDDLAKHFGTECLLKSSDILKINTVSNDAEIKQIIYIKVESGVWVDGGNCQIREEMLFYLWEENKSKCSVYIVFTWRRVWE